MEQAPETCPRLPDWRVGTLSTTTTASRDSETCMHRLGFRCRRIIRMDGRARTRSSSHAVARPTKFQQRREERVLSSLWGMWYGFVLALPSSADSADNKLVTRPEKFKVARRCVTCRSNQPVHPETIRKTAEKRASKHHRRRHGLAFPSRFPVSRLC